MKVIVTDSTVLVFETCSGSRYEINKGRVRRVNPGYVKRGDGSWKRLYNCPVLEVGKPVQLVIESLSHLGPDDASGEEGDVTVRTTSTVTGIDILGEGEW